MFVKLILSALAFAALPQHFANDAIFDGDLKVGKTLHGVQASTPSTGNIDALSVAGIYQLRLTGAAPVLRGMAGGTAGQELVVINASGNDATISNAAAAVAAGAKIITGSSSDLTFPKGAAFRFVYDGTTNDWHVAGGGGGTNFTASAPLAYDPATKLLSIPAATDSQNGYLTSADHTQLSTNTSNIAANTTAIGTKAPSSRAINTTAPLTGGGDLSADRTLSMPKATGTIDGYLSATDYASFAAKQAAGSYLTTGNNLSDLANPATARTNLGLGSFALKNSLVSGDIPNNAANTTGNASTATALAATPSQCGTGFHSTGISASGASNCVADSVYTVGGPLAQSTAGATTTFSIPKATGSVDGYLAATDYAAFNSKQAAGNYLTALTGDVTATGPGSAAAALSTTGVTPGSYTTANITVDAKGRISAASNGSGGSGTVTSVTGTAPVVSSGGATPAISMAKSNASTDGYLAGADFATFNAKQPAGSYQVGPLTGDVTTSVGAGAASISAGAVTAAKIASGAVPATLSKITQTAHGFTVGQVLRLNGTATYALAQADTDANAEVVGFVTSVIDANTFVLNTQGYIAGLSGLTANTTYRLSPTTAGALTTVTPTTPGQIDKPVLVSDGTSSGYVIQSRGIAINTPVPPTPANTAGDLVGYDGTNSVRIPAVGPGQVLAGDPSTTYKYSASDLAGPETIRNLGFSVSSASNALTVALTDNSGNALSISNVGKISFRKATAAGQTQLRTAVAPASITIPQGGTLGISTFQKTPIYLYLIDNAGSLQLGLAARLFDEGTLQNTTAISSTASDNRVIYSTNAISGAAIRLLGVINATETIAGTYTNAAAYDLSQQTSNKSQAAQISNGGVWVGQIKATGCANPWSQNTTTYQNFPVQTGCVYTVTGSGISAPSTMIPGFTLNGPSGLYRFEANGFIGGGSNGYEVAFRFTDGTTNSAEDNNSFNSGGANYNPVISGELNYAAAPAGKTIQIQSLTINTSYTSTVYATGGSFGNRTLTINVYRYPTQASQAGAIITKDPATSMAAQATIPVTTVPANPGEYRAQIRAANGFSYSTNTTPTTLPSLQNGFLLYTSGATATADTAGQPSKYEIFVGKNLNPNQWGINWYGTANKTGLVNTTPGTISSTDYGADVQYDANSGVLLVLNHLKGNTNTVLGFSFAPGTSASANQNFAYFDVWTYTNPLAAGLSPAQDEIYFTGGAGYGSTNTGVRRFNALSAKGSNITCTQSATLGDSCTINADGVYALSFGELNGGTSISVTSLTVNSTFLNYNNLSVLTPSPLVTGVIYTSNNANFNSAGQSGGTTLNLKKGDVVRFQESNSNTANSGADARIFMRITKIPSPFDTVAGAGGGNVFSSANTVTEYGIFAGGISAGNQPASNCTTSPCVKVSGSQNIGLTRSSTGVYVATFPVGTFSAPPQCVCNGGWTSITGADVCGPGYVGSTSTSFGIYHIPAAGGSPIDSVTTISCTGPK